MDNKTETFDDEHGDIVLNALEVYAGRMRKAAAEAHGGANAPERTVEGGTRTISVRPTRGGFAGMARAFTDAADKADAAHKAYEHLTGRDEPEDQP